MWLSRRHEKTLSSWVSNRQNRGLIRQYKHRVNDGSAMKYLHPESMLGWEGEWVGFIIWGWTGCHTAHHSVILKAKQKEKKRETERQEERKKKRKKRKKSYWFGDVLLFAIVFIRARLLLRTAALQKAKFLLILKRDSKVMVSFFLIFKILLKYNWFPMLC